MLPPNLGQQRGDGSRPRPSKGCREGGSRPCQTNATGRPTTSTRGAGCGRIRNSLSPRQRYRIVGGARGGDSCPRQQSRMPYHIGSRAKIAEIVKGSTTPNSRLIKGDGLQGGAAHAPTHQSRGG